MKVVFNIFIGMVWCTLPAYGQQAWTQSKGNVYLHTGVSSLRWSSLHNGGDDPILLPRSISEHVLSGYLEYGITDRWMLSASLPFHVISSGSLNDGFSSSTLPEGNLTALGNIGLAMTYALLQKDGLVVSGKLGFKGRTSQREEVTGLQSGYQASAATASLLAGLGTNNYFTSGELGLQIFGNDYLSRLLLSAQLGKEFGASRKLLLILALSSQTLLGSSSDTDSARLDGLAAQTGLYVNEQSFLAATFKVGYRFTQSLSGWISIGGGAAKNIARGIAYSASVGFDL